MDKPLVKVTDLTVYRKENKVLSGINFSMEKGEFIYLTGIVGSGKSSLLKVLYADETFKNGNEVIGIYDNYKFDLMM